MNSIVQYILYLAVLVALAIPLGGYIAKALAGEAVFLSKLLRPCEHGIYKRLRINDREDMSWKKYLSQPAADILTIFLIKPMKNMASNNMGLPTPQLP